MRYFRKELPQRPVVLSSGAIVQFEILDDSLGVLQTDNKELIEELDALVGSLGLSSITRLDYLALKKKTRLENIKRKLADSNRSSSASKGVGGAKVKERKKCAACGGRR